MHHEETRAGATAHCSLPFSSVTCCAVYHVMLPAHVTLQNTVFWCFCWLVLLRSSTTNCIMTAGARRWRTSGPLACQLTVKLEFFNLPRHTFSG